MINLSKVSLFVIWFTMSLTNSALVAHAVIIKDWNQVGFSGFFLALSIAATLTFYFTKGNDNE